MSSEVKVVEQQQDQYLGMIQSAVEKGADIAQIEKLMDLKERFEDRQAEKDFNIAMAGFQSTVPIIEKAGKVEYKATKYSYAKLEDIAQAIRPSLKENGLSYRFSQEQDGAHITVACIITHSSGHTISNSLTSLPDTSGNKDALKSIASTITYLRRYTLTGALGIVVGGEDDDGGSDQSGMPSLPKNVNEVINGMCESWNNEALSSGEKKASIISLWNSISAMEQMQAWANIEDQWRNALNTILKYKEQDNE